MEKAESEPQGLHQGVGHQSVTGHHLEEYTSVSLFGVNGLQPLPKSRVQLHPEIFIESL